MLRTAGGQGMLCRAVLQGPPDGACDEALNMHSATPSIERLAGTATRHGRRLIAVLLVTLVTGALVLGTNRGLESTDTPHGMLNLQFAASLAEAQAVLRSWENRCAISACAGLAPEQVVAEGHAAARRLRVAHWTLALDFPFMIAYSTFLWMLCRQVIGASGGPGVLRSGASFAAPLAGLADASENVVHWMFLEVGAEGLGPALFSWGHYSAGVKWTLIAAIAACLALAGACAAWRRFRRGQLRA